MFNLGWMEMLIIGVTALVVVGPKDLPVMFRTVGNAVGKARKMAAEFRSTMEAAADDTGLKEASDMLTGLRDVKDPSKFLKKEAREVLHNIETDTTENKFHESRSVIKKTKSIKK